MANDEVSTWVLTFMHLFFHSSTRHSEEPRLPGGGIFGVENLGSSPNRIGLDWTDRAGNNSRIGQREPRENQTGQVRTANVPELQNINFAKLPRSSQRK